MASRLFCCWLRSTEQVTWMPVGLWVMRTAVATLFTFCPPGPLARTKATMSMSAFGNFHFAVVLLEIRDDVDRGEARLPFALGVERAGANEPVDARFGPQVAVGVFALDQQHDVLNPGLLTPGAVDFARRPSPRRSKK